MLPCVAKKDGTQTGNVGLGRVRGIRQEEPKIESSQESMARPCLKQTKNKERRERNVAF